MINILQTHQTRWRIETVNHAKPAEVCGYPMYKDSKTEEPFVLELYRARGAAVTCRRVVSYGFPALQTWCIVVLSESTVATCSKTCSN